MRPLPMITYQEDKAKRNSETHTSFIIKPLERGFATTIGTALRRTMLSSITSVAPFAIKIKGLDHEFTAIKGVVEDVQKIILNIRDVQFIYDPAIFEDDKIYRGTINVTGRNVRASDIIFDLPIKIFNREAEIATLSAEINFNVEIFLIANRGYVDFHTNKIFVEEHASEIVSNIKKGKIIAIDSDFSPVKKVAIHSREINTSSVLIEEELEIEIETKGTVSARAIISQACQILVAHFNEIGNLRQNDHTNIFENTNKVKIEANSITNREIKDLPLSVRSINALQRHGFRRFGDIINISEDDLNDVKNLGKKSIQEILDLLKEHNITISKGDE